MRIRKLSIIAALFTAIYCIIKNTNYLYDYIFIIPLFYAIGSFIYSIALYNINSYGLNLVYVIAQTLMFIRYVVTPFFTVFSASFTSWGWGPDPTSWEMLAAEIMMCLEECIIFFVHYAAIKKYSRKHFRRIINNNNYTVYNERYALLVVYIIVAAVFVLSKQPALLLMDNYFIYTGNSDLNETSMPGMYVILSDTFKKVFLIVALIYCKKKYNKHRNKIYLLLAASSVAFNMALNTGGTRIRMVFALILGVYFLVYVFGKIPKILYIFGAVLCLVSFISVSTVKFSYAIGDSTNLVTAVLTIMSGQFQDYFAGPRLIGQMIEVHKIYGNRISISTFINDFTGSIPIISNSVNQADRINYYFNIYCNMNNQTLIAPVLGIGYCYCPAFPFFFSIIFEYFVIKLDYKMTITNQLTYKYLYAYMGYVCGMCMGYSTQNIYAQFVSAFIPLLVLFKLNNCLQIGIVQYRKRCGEEKIEYSSNFYGRGQFRNAKQR